MKSHSVTESYIVTALAMTLRLIESDLNSPTHLALSYNEEPGCLGVRGLLDALGREGFHAICGQGIIEQVHKPNEFVALRQVQACEVLMERLTA